MGSDHECNPPWTSDDMGGLLARPESNGAVGLMRRHLPRRVHRLKERHECSGLRGTQVVSVGGHIAAALDYLADELVMGELYGHAIQLRPPLPSQPAQRVAVVTRLGLKNERPRRLQAVRPLQVRRG